MKGDIKLSPQHGVNPSIGVCFYCGEDSGEIILPGRLKGDVEAPRRAVQPPTLAEEILTARMAFVPDDVWRALGLPALPGGAA
jgi:hypothetical protein